MKAFLDEQQETKQNIPAEYDEQLVRRLIEKVIVYDERFAVEFRSAVMIDVKR